MGIRVEEPFECGPEDLWAIVGVPDRVDWVAGVEACEFDGEVRRMRMEGAGAVAERILELDQTGRRIRYTVCESAAPLDHHEAMMQVVDADGGCRLIWTTEVEPATVEPFIEQAMHACIGNLHTLTQS